MLGESALYIWAVGALRDGCSSPTAVLLLLCALHESLLTLLEAGVFEDYEDTQSSVKEEIPSRFCRKSA